MKTDTEFLVMKNKANSQPLLSLETSTALGVLSVINSITGQTEKYSNLMKKYRTVFNGLGQHKDIQAKFIINQSVQPII